MKSEHEKSIFDTDYCEAEDENARLVKKHLYEERAQSIRYVENGR